VLQGFAKPVDYLSRGASVHDIIATTAVVLALA
ncbi:MAG: phosphate acyltransferase, partial [Alphaproteobacteria bacterium]|nr:phosphate acyltransferase [Alphaproteobacteria bacterium]